MKQRYLVWMPPDGDARLTTLQDDLAFSSGRAEFGARPPHLMLPEGTPRPTSPVRTGAWVDSPEGLFLELFEGKRLLGLVRLAEAWRVEAGKVPRPAEDWGEAPVWTWRRGKWAMMTVWTGSTSLSWSFEPVSGWKA
ncbi:MAG: hypothetical protein WCG80_12105 [Spirochaetales bacterium]